MSPATAMRMARDLVEAANIVRKDDPEIAARWDGDREAFFQEAQPLTVTATAELLEQSRQTIHDWVKRGILDTHPSGSTGKLRIDARSVASILPYIEEWRKAGGTRRALAFIIARLEEKEETAALLAHSLYDSNGRPVVADGAVGFGVSTD